MISVSHAAWHSGTADFFPHGEQVAQYLQVACHHPLPKARDRSASIPELRGWPAEAPVTFG